jgi:signal transduction histidine kinase
MPIAVGLYAWHRRPGERFGPLLVAAGFGWFLTTLAESDQSLVYSVGRVAGWVVEIGLVWLILSFPSGRLTAPVDRMLVLATAALVAVLYLPTTLLANDYVTPAPYTSCTEGCPDNAFFVFSSEPAILDGFFIPTREVLTLVIFLAVTARVAQRVTGASPLMRRTLNPVLFVAGARVLLVAIGVGARWVNPESAFAETSSLAIALALPAIAAAFFVGLFQRRLYAADALQKLATRITGRSTPEEMRAALADALQDPSLQIVYPVNGSQNRWVDLAGDPVAAPVPESGRALSEIRNGNRIAAGIVHDAALSGQRAFIQAVSSYALVALENRRLTAKVESSLGEVRKSRARILASADRERRRLERDLHDGAQQRLVALSLQLRMIRSDIRRNPEQAEQLAVSASDELAHSLKELRELARGIHPAALDHGLASALESLATRSTVATAVSCDAPERVPPAVELAVYFVACEALANVGKYADATAASVRLSRTAGGVAIEIADDGVGGADAGNGSGLHGLADRVEALDGHLFVTSPPGAGTVIIAELPCAS